MAITAAAVKAALAALTDEQARKTVGWIAAAVLAPIILIAALLLSLLSGTTQHNNAAVDLVFNGGVVPSSMSAEYAAQVRVMQTCLEELDSAVAEVNDQMESGSLDGNWVKAVFFSLCFWDEHLKLTPSEARDFADCFVRYEERTRTVASGTDPDTGETIYTEETYTVAVPVDQEIAFNNLDAAGYPITEDLVVNAQAVYDRIAYGAADGYTGEIQYGSSRITELDTSDFTAPTTKNAEDLVAYVTHAWESGWGYVWGTFGQTLTESLMESKIRQYPDGVGSYAESGSSEHVRPDDELPVNLSGLETLNMTWDLFETAAQMDDLSDRQEMLNFAKWMEESQNLLDWIKLTQAEREAWKEGSASA